MKRQMVLGGVALVSVLIGYGLGLLSRPEPAPKPPPEVAVPAPVLPESNGHPLAAPLLAYEEALPDDIYEPEPGIGDTVASVGGVAYFGGPGTVPEPEPVAPRHRGPLPGEVNLLPMPAPSVGADRLPAWLRYAVSAPATGNRPAIAIVIDDLGLDRKRTARTIALPGPLTLAFLPYADGLPRQAEAARAAGHELLVHMGMQPMSDAVDPGPNVLRGDLPTDELKRRIAWGLSRFDGYVGVNNHMGSRFTADREGMSVVLDELKKRGLLFLDSRTTGRSVADDVARDRNVPNATRNVFLDNVNDVEAVRSRLDEVERIAQRTGRAIAIGHPRDATLTVLNEWIGTLESRGFALVPLSLIVAENYAGEVAAAFLQSERQPQQRIGDPDAATDGGDTAPYVPAAPEKEDANAPIRPNDEPVDEQTPRNDAAASNDY